jgi:hypothetical protein
MVGGEPGFERGFRAEALVFLGSGMIGAMVEGKDRTTDPVGDHRKFDRLELP